MLLFPWHRGQTPLELLLSTGMLSAAIERLSTLLSSLAVSVAKSMGVGGARKQIRSQKPDEREISAFCLETTHRGVGAIFHLPGKKK